MGALECPSHTREALRCYVEPLNDTMFAKTVLFCFPPTVVASSWVTQYLASGSPVFQSTLVTVGQSYILYILYSSSLVPDVQKLVSTARITDVCSRDEAVTTRLGNQQAPGDKQGHFGCAHHHTLARGRINVSIDTTYFRLTSRRHG